MTVIAFDRAEVFIKHGQDLDQTLDHVLRRLQPTAISQGTGILVTRKAPGRFTLELSHDVPFGYTYEKA